MLPALLLGVALGNVIRGVPLNAQGDYTGTFWQLLNPFSLLVGVTGLAMFVSHGASWAALKTEGALQLRAARVRFWAHLVFLALVVLTTIYAAFEVSDHARHVVTRPMGWVMIVAFVGGAALARVAMARKRDFAAFIGSALSVAALMGIAAVGNYPAIVPARGSAAGTALTAAGSSSSNLTLTVMLVVAALGMPVVVGLLSGHLPHIPGTRPGRRRRVLSDAAAGAAGRTARRPRRPVRPLSDVRLRPQMCQYSRCTACTRSMSACGLRGRAGHLGGLFVGQGAQGGLHRAPQGRQVVAALQGESKAAFGVTLRQRQAAQRHVRVAALGDLHAPQRVVDVRVEAGRNEHRLRRELIDDGLHHGGEGVRVVCRRRCAAAAAGSP